MAIMSADELSVDELTDQVILLFEQYHVPVFNYVRQLTGDSEWAHDLTQEAFLRLYQSRQRLPQVKNQRAWLYRIASNVTFSALKRRRRFRWLPWQDDIDPRLQTAGPATDVAQQEAVQQALKQLKPIYRAALILYSQYDLTVREMAEVLAISESNVKVRLHRARKLFQIAYDQEQKSE
ncbi:MAG: RNA polymerase sigma factor [Chloroflexi bacterium]|nr:RNA polymerase sigma factor [Chloroflexota bacterium]